MKNIRNQFIQYQDLRYKLWDLCNVYVISNNIIATFDYLEFRDFIVVEKNKGNEIELFFIDEDGNSCCTYHSISFDDIEKFDKEYASLNCVITNLLSGRYLINGEKQNQYDIDMLKEFLEIIDNVNNRKGLTDRQKYLLRMGGTQFYEGFEDMCEQLNINYENLIKLL